MEGYLQVYLLLSSKSIEALANLVAHKAKAIIVDTSQRDH